MSQRAKLFEKYRKSDIFNFSNIDLNKTQKLTHIPYLNNTFNSRNPITSKENPIINQKKMFNNQKKYVSKHHQSDIFNLNHTLQPEKNTETQKRRNIPNYSTCFDGMKDNNQYSNDLKEYTKKNRGIKTSYNPLKYFNNVTAHQRKYSQLYGNSKNTFSDLSKKNKSMMKTSENFFSKMNIDKNNLNNTSDRIQLYKDVENAFKTHKFYKTKGFTYFENDNNGGRNNDNHKFVPTEQNDISNTNNSKINKQLQLQSNIFNLENIQKNENDINKIKQRIILAENTDESKPKKYFLVDNNTKNKEETNKSENILSENMEDKNIWGAIHNHWEKSNIDWKKDKTEIIFNKSNRDDENITAFQRKMNQLADSSHKDTINETIKLNRKNNNVLNRQKFISNLEQIDEILNDIPNNVLKYDKKRKLLEHANTTGLNGETDIEKNIMNYKNYDKNNVNKKNKDDITIKIMSKESQTHFNNKKKEEKICNNLKKFDNYNIHDYILSYDSRTGINKNLKNNFDKFSENDVRLLFSKNGVHIYDIRKNLFTNGKYNVIKFKVRENVGEQILEEKMKEIENILNSKEYKISIKKEEQRNNKKNLRNVAKAPFSKKTIFIDEIDSKNNLKQNENNKNKNNKKNIAFSSQYAMINTNYKNHYKEEELKNKVNK